MFVFVVSHLPQSQQEGSEVNQSAHHELLSLQAKVKVSCLWEDLMGFSQGDVLLDRLTSQKMLSGVLFVYC